MRCETAKRRLPLYAGGDLSARKARKLQAHLERCSSCRKEAEEFRAALDRVRKAAKQAITPDWDEAAWNGTMVRIAAEKPFGKRRYGAPVPRWAFAAAGLGVVLITVLALYFFKDTLFRQKDGLHALLPAATETAPLSPDRQPPDVELDPGALKGDPGKTATGLVGREAEAGSLGDPRKPDPAKGDPSSKRKSASRESSLGALDIAKPAGAQDPEIRISGAGREAASVPQDVLSITIVSQETGLQIAWFFHKEFDWKGDEK
jgi:hypothetical protein